jgi:DNA-binding MarR family transcriptional regulator
MKRTAAPRVPRHELLAALDRTIRMVGAQSVLISQATAAKAGINSTDMECLDLLHLEGPATPRRLAELTGLTTGAVTMLVDRLERSGFVRRTPNPADRRSIIVEALPAGAQVLAPLFEPLSRAMGEVNDRYRDADLAIVLDYLSAARDAGAAHLRWLERAPPVAARGAVRQKDGRAKQGRRPADRRRAR